MVDVDSSRRAPRQKLWAGVSGAVVPCCQIFLEISVNTLGLRELLSALAVDVGALELVRVAIISLWVPRDAYYTFAICLWHFLGSFRALVSAGTNAGVVRVLLHTQQTLSIY